MTKITYIDALNAALTCDLSDEIKEKLTALKEQLVKRNTAKSDKPTKTQRENAEVKARILEYLTHTLQGLRCGEIASELGISGQKCSALLSQLVKSGEVVKREGEKRVTLFLLPENDMTDPANS
jgi:predicted transcriptional regulator